jgi:hypothetical protein
MEFVVVPRNPLRVSIPSNVPRFAGSGLAGVANVAFVAQAETPVLSARAFKIRIDLSDFDIRAPSLVFIDPWTDQLIPYASLFRAMNFDAARGPHLVLLDDHPSTHRPFLCVRGLREYHEHPQHTGDDWMLYRPYSGVFSLLATVWRTCVDLVTPNLLLQPNQLMVNWEVSTRE